MARGIPFATWARTLTLSGDPASPIVAPTSDVWKKCPYEPGTMVQLFVLEVLPRTAIWLGPDRSHKRSPNTPNAPLWVNNNNADMHAWPAPVGPVEVGCSLFVGLNWQTEIVTFTYQDTPAPNLPEPVPTDGDESGVFLPYGHRAPMVAYRSLTPGVTWEVEVWFQVGSGRWYRYTILIGFPWSGFDNAISHAPNFPFGVDAQRILIRLVNTSGGAGAQVEKDYGLLTAPERITIDGTLEPFVTVRFAAVPVEYLQRMQGEELRDLLEAIKAR